MQKHIQIEYYPNAQSTGSLALYNYDIDLDSSEQMKIDYFTGKQRDTQMNALAFALKSALPDDAIIKQINNVPYESTKDSILDMLSKKDDYLATILFETNFTEKSEESDNETVSKVVNDSNVNQTEVKDDKVMTSEVKHIVEYQPEGKHAYHELDLSMNEPKDQEKIRKIGISMLTYTFNYQDLKTLLKGTKSDKLFINPLGLVPTNGKVTATRKHTFSTNAGLAEDALDNVTETKIGQIKNTNNGKEYNLFIFNINKEPKGKKMEENKETVETESENVPKPAQVKEQVETVEPVQVQAESAKQTATQEPSVNSFNNAPARTQAPSADAFKQDTSVTPGTINPLTGTPINANANEGVADDDKPMGFESLADEKAQGVSNSATNTTTDEDIPNGFTPLTKQTQASAAPFGNTTTTKVAQQKPSNEPTGNATGVNQDKVLKAIQDLQQILANKADLNDLVNTIIDKLDHLDNKPQEPEISASDLAKLPESLVQFNQSEQAKSAMARMNAILQLNEILMNGGTDGTIPERFKCFEDPNLYLMAVHLLSKPR